MAQTSGRYPIIDSKHAAGTLYGICMMKGMIEFLEGWDAKSDVDIVPPGKRLTHNQYKLLIGRAAKTLEAVLLYGGTMDEDLLEYTVTVPFAKFGDFSKGLYETTKKVQIYVQDITDPE